MKANIPAKHLFSRQELEALDREMHRQMIENVERLTGDIMALMLWQLHSQLGFGRDRLLKFHSGFREGLKELNAHYQMGKQDQVFLCKHELKQLGVDLDELPNALEFEMKVKR